jgi:hypothetical protein
MATAAVAEAMPRIQARLKKLVEIGPRVLLGSRYRALNCASLRRDQRMRFGLRCDMLRVRARVTKCRPFLTQLHTYVAKNRIYDTTTHDTTFQLIPSAAGR